MHLSTWQTLKVKLLELGLFANASKNCIQLFDFSTDEINSYHADFCQDFNWQDHHFGGRAK